MASDLRRFKIILNAILSVRLFFVIFYLCIRARFLTAYCIGSIVLLLYLNFVVLSNYDLLHVLIAIYVENSIYCLLVTYFISEPDGVCTFCFIYIILAHYIAYSVNEFSNNKKLIHFLCIGQAIVFLIGMIFSLFDVFHPMYIFHSHTEKHIFYWMNVSITLVAVSFIGNTFREEIQRVHEIMNAQFQAMQVIAQVDPLTGLSNHGATKTFFDSSTKDSAIITSNLSLILCDISDLKSLNSTYGHECGDFVLQRTAEILKNASEDATHISRWQGDSFLLFFNEDLAQANIHIVELQKALSFELFVFNAKAIPVTFSFGIAQYKNGFTIEQLLDVADDNRRHCRLISD